MYLPKKVWSLLNYSQKKYAIYILIMMFFAMFLETLSVGIILPLLSALFNSDGEMGFFQHILSFFQLIEYNLIYSVLLITLIIFLVKNFFLAFNLWNQANFIRKLEYEFTNRLFQNYLKSDYLFFLQNNSSHLYRNLTSIIGSFVDYTNRHILLINETIVFIGITAILFYIDALGTSVILISVTILSTIIYLLTIKKIHFLGNARNIISGDLNKHLLQGMASAKDIKILGREDDLVYQVDKNLFKITNLNHNIKFINGIPKFAFEILLIIVFIALVLVMINAKREMVDIIQYLGVFAVASLRIVPAAARIFSSYQMIRYQEAAIKIFIKQIEVNTSPLIINSKKNNKKSVFEFKNEINLSNISFEYDERKKFTLSKVSMTIKKGSFIGIIGETGSGKSTLINLIIGLLKPSEGQIEVDKSNININLIDWYKKIGYVPQSVYLTDDTIKKNIAFGLLEEDIDNNLIKQAVEKASLSKLLSSLPEGLETIVGEKGIRLSGGQQQRIGIARALYRDPEILVLDEATSSLDQTTEKKIMESINFLKRKKTLIIITHRLSTVKNCDKVFFIEEGKIIKQGSPQTMLNNV